MSDRAFKVMVWVTAVLICIVFWVQVGKWAFRWYEGEMNSIHFELQQIDKKVDKSLELYRDLREDRDAETE